MCPVKNGGITIYPYLLRHLVVERPNQVWAMDITYIPMARGFVYLAAVVDWFSRKVLSWRVSITLDTEFCLEAVEGLWHVMESLRCSIPIKAANLPALPL